MSGKKKRVTLDLRVKLSIISEIENGKKQSQVCFDRNLPKQTVCGIWCQREKIKKSADLEVSGKRKRMRAATFEDVEEALLIWFRNARSQNIPVSGLLLREKALLFAHKMGHPSFAGSSGWLDRFKSRHGIVLKDTCGEAASVDQSTVERWRSVDLPALLRSFTPRDVFNADEAGLFYRLLPSQTMCFKGDKCVGGKRSKERLTVLVAGNMDGSEKLPLLVIGKSQKPRCFKNVRSLPVEYTSNKKAWMTSKIFTDWLSRLDRRFREQGRHVLLLVDNCTAHPKVLTLDAITLAYLPANTTSVLQPCDQGIIANLKVNYRRLITNRLCDSVEHGIPFEVNILFAIRMLDSAWNNVSQSTIANCFRHAGMLINMCKDAPESESETMGEHDESLENESFPDDVLVEYASVDDGVITSEIPTDDDIVEELRNGSASEEFDESGQDSLGDEEEEQPPPQFADAVRALDTLQRYLCTIERSECAQKALLNVETLISRRRFENMRQTSISSFFM